MNDQQWTALPGIRDFTFTAETNVDPGLIALLRGPEKPVTGHAVQLDYQIPVQLRWWSRAWLWARRRPVPTVQRRLVIPHATVALTEPED